MIIEKRPAVLLNYFLQVKQTNMNQIMATTQLTKRQVTYDLEKVNQWLKDRGLPTIQYKGSHSHYIVVPEEVIGYFQEQEQQKNQQQTRDFIFTEEERLSILYLYLFIRTEMVSSIHLTQLLQVSKNTMISDVKRANEKNSPYLVEICYSRQKGYHLRGSEYDKRVLVMHCISQLHLVPYFEKLIDYLLKEKSSQLQYRDILSTLQQVEKKYKLHFVEDRLSLFSYFLAFIFYRQQGKKQVQFHLDEIELLKKETMWKVACDLTQQLHIAEEEAELCYITIQLLGLSLGNSSIKNSSHNLLFKLCEQLVFDFESRACIVFEKKDEVVQSLYQHLKPAYFRMKYRIPSDNPLLQQIKNEHKELFTIVKEILSPIGSLLRISIPEEEVGYITIHFGALLEKPKHVIPKKKRALVVCPSGISSSLMVKHQLESLFSELVVEKTLSLQEFQNGNYDDYDLIFSTVRIDTKLPCFYVKPIMTPTEKNHLVNEVYQLLFGIHYQDLSQKELLQTIGKFANIFDEDGLKQALSQMTFHKKVDVYRGKQPVLDDLLQEDTIQIIEELSDWEEAIKVAANPLLAKGSIESSYIQAMIENIKLLGPYVIIGPEIAIPHARPEQGVNQVGMSFLKLKKPVNFLNNEQHPVRLIFCIAAVDNTTHLKALSQLTKLLSSPDNLDRLKSLESTEEILEIFTKYSAIA